MKKIITLVFIITASCFNANAQYSTLLNFAGVSNGTSPDGSLISDGTFLYGMTQNGGTNNDGVIFKVKPDGTMYSTLLNFAGVANGNGSHGSLLLSGTFLYGMTNYGGTNGMGVIFKIKTDGTTYSTILNFAGSLNGSQPQGSLISDGTFLYGMTSQGGTNSQGVLFKIMPDGSAFTKLIDFAGVTNGGIPVGDLYYDGTFLYGMTSQGGTSSACTTYGCGTIFKIMTNGTGYVKLHDFNGTSGQYPYGSLISDGAFLYGMTNAGGANSKGTIFKIMLNGTGYVDMVDFTGAANGKNPYGSLISEGTYLYGMTNLGGGNNMGTIFKIMPNGTGYSKLLDFGITSNGSGPQGSLFSDGTYFYGMTKAGGTNSDGIVFKLGIATAGIAENNAATDFNIYPNPSNGIFTLNSSITKEEISICNLLGKIVFQSNINNQTSTIDLSDQPNGIYFITIKTEKDSFTQKIMINH